MITVTTMNKLPVDLKKLNPKAQIPTNGSLFAAGNDLYACLEESLSIAPGETEMIPTGIAIAIPTGYAGLILARSGIASKKGLAPANKVGLIDSDYRGEILVALHNHSNSVQTIEPGERVAQIMIIPYLPTFFDEVEELDETERGAGGFGSTGRK